MKPNLLVGFSPRLKSISKAFVGGSHHKRTLMSFVLFMLLLIPAWSQPDLQFVAYGDSRSNSSMHNTITGLINGENPELVIHSGDLWDGYASSTWVSHFTSKPNLNTLLNNNKILVARGNHESESAVLALSPPFVRNNSLTYSFREGNVFFVCLSMNPSTVSSYLETELQKPEAQSADFRVIYHHYPIYSAGSHGASGNATIEAICDRYDVTMSFAGHDHDYERTKVMYNRQAVFSGNVVPSNIQGTTYVVTGGGGAPPYNVGTKSWTDYSVSTYHYCSLKSYSDRLEMTVKNSNGQVIETFVRRKYSNVQYTLTTSTTGQGSVSLNPSGGTYAEGTVVALTATPAAGWKFERWSGDATGTLNPVNVTMNANKTVTAIFSALPTYTLTTNTVGQGSVELNPAGGTYYEGYEVTLTAKPALGYKFDSWSGDATGTQNPVKITMNANKTVTATFVAIPTYTLTTNTVGQGTITLDPSGGTYNENTVVTLTAKPALGYKFDSWSGAASGTTNPVTVNMNANKTVTATFVVIPTYTLTTNTVGQGTIVSDPSGGTYNENTVVALTATPALGWKFDNWSGAATGTQNPLNVTMDANKTLTANFSELPAVAVIAENQSGGDKMDIKEGQEGAQSFLYNNPTGLDYQITKVVLYLSKESDSPNGALEFNIETGVNSGTISGSSVNIPASAITNSSGGSSFQAYEVVFSNPVGPLVSGTSYYLNFENNSPNGKAYFIEFTGGNTYPNGTYYKSNSNEEKDSRFQIWGGRIGTTPVSYTLTTSVIGQGTISLNPAGSSYTSGTVVNATATAAAGYEFAGWSGAATGTTNPMAVTMDANKTLTATFTAVVPTYTLTTSVVGQGTVSLSPAGGSYTSGTVVNATATAAAGYEFTGWSGAATGTINPVAVTMDANKTLTATFTAVVPTYTLTTSVVGQGTVSPSPAGGSYTSGTVVNVTATAAAGYEFAGWSGAATGTQNPVAVTMNANKTVTATFSALPTYTLTTNTVGQGSVSLNPAGGTYNENTVVALTATPTAGYKFDGWSGAATGTQNPVNVTMNANKTVTATFSALPSYTLTTTVVGTGTISLSPSGGSYVQGTVVSVTANAGTRYQFNGWSGDLSGTANPTSITMDANKTVTANFGLIPTEVILTQNTSGGDKMEVNEGQRGAQSFNYGASDYKISKVVVYLSRDEEAPTGDLHFSIGTGVNTGAISGSTVNITPSQVANTSEGSSFTAYEIVYSSPVGPFNAGTTYYLNMENDAPNGKKYYFEFDPDNHYPNGTYFKELSDEEKDMRFQIWGGSIGNKAAGYDDNMTDMRIYPNPAKDQIVVEYNSRNPKIMEIRNITGVLLKTVQLTDGKTIVDISELKQGIYILSTPGTSVKPMRLTIE